MDQRGPPVCAWPLEGVDESGGGERSEGADAPSSLPSRHFSGICDGEPPDIGVRRFGNLRDGAHYGAFCSNLRNDPAKGLLNGSLWQVMSSSKETVKPGINLMIRPEDDDMDRGAAKIKLLKAAFENVTEEIPWSTRKRYDEFDFGYALTVHKAQGSQWNNVVLFDESFAFRDTRERWLYTAITRAAETLTIVR